MENASRVPLPRVSDRTFYLFTAALSTAALAFIAWILLGHRGATDRAALGFLPGVNAALNGAAAALLCAGWVAIRRRARRVHQYLMVSAFVASSLFLVCYLVYHYVHGDTRFAGRGAARAVYLLVLASHVLLSMAVVPLALTSFWFAFHGRFAQHRKVARVTLPVWLYVSVTGVVVYVMLHRWPAG